MGRLLAASDIDGTLLRTDDKVSARTVAAIRSFSEAGGIFVYATGRPPRWVHPIAELACHRSTAICSNGAVTIDLTTGAHIDQRLLAAADARAIVAALQAGVPDVTFAVDAVDMIGHDPAYRPRWAMPPGHRVAPIMELLTGPIIKLLVRVEGATGEYLMEHAQAILGDQASVTRSSNEGLVEITRPDVTKASALARLADSHGVQQDDVWAFGDMPNDIEMISWAGTGVAMGNAHPTVLEVANRVTEHVNDDGVAIVLEEIAGSLAPAGGNPAV
jgi:Cof subfamily protein (haloacid dehalogenase superfamily)